MKSTIFGRPPSLLTLQGSPQHPTSVVPELSQAPPRAGHVWERGTGSRPLTAPGAPGPQGAGGRAIPDSSMFLVRNQTPQNFHVASFPAQLTFHIFLDVVHQGLDGIGEVPGVLLDADLDQAPATDCTLLLLFELWGRKGTREQERDS